MTKNKDLNEALKTFHPGVKVPLNPKEPSGPAVTVWPISLVHIAKFQTLMEEAGTVVMAAGGVQSTEAFTEVLTKKIVPLILKTGRDLLDDVIDCDVNLIPLPFLPLVITAMVEQSLGLDQEENPFVTAVKSISKKVLGRESSMSEILSNSSSLMGTPGPTSSTASSPPSHIPVGPTLNTDTGSPAR